MRMLAFLGLTFTVVAFHPLWHSLAPWHDQDDIAAEKKEAEKYSKGKTGVFPLNPHKLEVLDYKWSKKAQRVAVETSAGSVYFRTYIAREVFAAQLAEYLGLCISKSRRLPWNNAISRAWQDTIQDVHQKITPENDAHVQYLFDDHVGVQEVEYIEGPTIVGYEAAQSQGYERILFEVGKIFGFDMFLHDPNNCRYIHNGAGWTCKEGNLFNFIVSPTRGVCGSARAYTRLEMNGQDGLRFQEFFKLADTGKTSGELSKSLAYIASGMFGEAMTIERREVAEALLKGAKWTLNRLVQVERAAFQEISKTSGLHESFGFGLGERVRMLRLIVGLDVKDSSYAKELAEEQVDADGDIEGTTDTAEDTAEDHRKASRRDENSFLSRVGNDETRFMSIATRLERRGLVRV